MVQCIVYLARSVDWLGSQGLTLFSDIGGMSTSIFVPVTLAPTSVKDA